VLTQSIRWGRVIIGGIIAEVAVILILIALVATFGLSEPASAQAFLSDWGVGWDLLAGRYAVFSPPSVYRAP